MECYAPKAGDIIIRREVGKCWVQQFPGLPQVSYKSFDLALDVATRFARSAGTDVFFEQDGQFGLIESRGATSP